jgi:hypothetical protein
MRLLWGVLISNPNEICKILTTVFKALYFEFIISYEYNYYLFLLTTLWTKDIFSFVRKNFSNFLIWSIRGRFIFELTQWSKIINLYIGKYLSYMYPVDVIGRKTLKVFFSCPAYAQAPPHFCHHVRNHLDREMARRWIGRDEPIA